MFLSGDRDEKSFDEYYGEMPWCTLKYDDRSMKKSLSQMFDVDGIPTLILLKGTLLIITSNKARLGVGRLRPVFQICSKIVLNKSGSHYMLELFIALYRGTQT